jgi:uncharacterized protein (TIGR03435 family)
VCGVLRSVVILPEDAQSWDETDLERALVHELEHVRRYDWVIHCLARVVCAAYWFHPLVWAAWRQLTLEAERSCDDAVLRNSDAAAYADQLLGLARRRSAIRRSPALAMANRSDLAARIGALLDRGQPRGPAGASMVAAFAGAAAIVLAVSPLRVIAAPRSPAPGAAQSIPKWDAVSIKPCTNAAVAPAETRSVETGQSSGKQTWDCVHVKTLINQAYTIFAGGQRNPPQYPAPIERLPAWADSERYTIEAKSQANPGAQIMRGPMLQALLEDRFALKIRREIRKARVYRMTAANGGSKLLPFQGGCTPYDLVHIPASASAIQNPCPESRQSKGPKVTVDIPGLDLDSFAFYIGMTTGSDGPVSNQTGLAGIFHFHLEFSPNAKPGDPAYAAAVFTAIEEQLGLRVEAGTGPRKFLVVDQIETPVTPASGRSR